MVLVKVYAPNWDSADFITNLCSSIPKLDSHFLVFGGDLNCVINPKLDHSNTRAAFLSKMANAISAYMSQTGCVDPWRFHNPGTKEFSFFSNVHHSYTRIDYFFIDKALLSFIKSVEYKAIVISDHAPLLLELSFPSTAPHILNGDLTLLCCQTKHFVIIFLHLLTTF